MFTQMYEVALVWLNYIENMQIMIQLCKMCMYNRLTASRQTDWQDLNLFNPIVFLLVAD